MGLMSRVVRKQGAVIPHLLIHILYGFIICSVAAVLYVAVNNLEPNRRYASALKILIITLAVVAFLAHLIR